MITLSSSFPSGDLLVGEDSGCFDGERDRGEDTAIWLFFLFEGTGENANNGGDWELATSIIAEGTTLTSSAVCCC